MVNMGQALAEYYMDNVNSDADLSVTGGGSGTGVAALINDDVDIAQVSRKMSEEEVEQAADNDVTAYEFVVGQDGLAVYTNPENPITELTVAELKAIFTGEINDWSELGWEDGGDISRFSRQTNSGTYVYFNENIMDGEDWGPGTQFLPGSAAIVEVSQDISGIGYYEEGMVVAVDVALDEGSEYYTPLEAGNVSAGLYPIARPLHFYTNGVPEGVTLHYLNWVLKEPEATTVLEGQGFYGIGDFQDQNIELYEELGLDW